MVRTGILHRLGLVLLFNAFKLISSERPIFLYTNIEAQISDDPIPISDIKLMLPSSTECQTLFTSPTPSPSASLCGQAVYRYFLNNES